MVGIEGFIKNASLLDSLTDPWNRLIMVMGGSDTGKTTLVESLVNFLSEQGEVGIVDLDMGQSHIGPPTTIAWGKTARGFQDWERIRVEEFYFTGSLTPMGNLLPSVAGAKLMTERALSFCERIVVDTTGLIAEPAGRVLKQYKIDALCPDIILALERSGELGHILDSFRFHSRPKVQRLKMPDQVTTKSMVKRSNYRLGKMEHYFRHACTREVSLEEVGIRFTRVPSGLGRMDLKNRVVSFRDKDNRDIALGIIREIELKDNLLSVLTPLGSENKISAIVIGSTEIDLTNSVMKDRR
ncbi:MAG TPA: Clp1/GlmU family protein [Thermodesulfovibrionales bacterium]|nr:Clp1/GlmU family protein [Thermodesulfovibrionales bacterium]